MSEKPLHVRVAEALGWQTTQLRRKPVCPTCRVQTEWFTDGHWMGWPPRSEEPYEDVPAFDTDWAATGPLIDTYEISVREDGPGSPVDRNWEASADYYGPPVDASDAAYGGRWATASERAHTPLVAICNLILALGAAGALMHAPSPHPGYRTGPRMKRHYAAPGQTITRCGLVFRFSMAEMRAFDRVTDDPQDPGLCLRCRRSLDAAVRGQRAEGGGE